LAQLAAPLNWRFAKTMPQCRAGISSERQKLKGFTNGCFLPRSRMFMSVSIMEKDAAKHDNTYISAMASNTGA